MRQLQAETEREIQKQRQVARVAKAGRQGD
jgi:hypothetical protein